MNMNRMLQFCVAVCIVLVGACATGNRKEDNGAAVPLPAEVAISKQAGHGGLLTVDLTLASGEKVPFVLDTGTGLTLIDQSFEPELGTPIGTSMINGWGVDYKARRYEGTKLYLGSTPLKTAQYIVSVDFKQIHVGRKVKGILGFDTLKHYCIQLDFTVGKMRFLDSSLLATQNLGTAFPIFVPGGKRPFIHHCGLAGGASTNSAMDTDPLGRDKSRELPVTYALIDSGFAMDGRVDQLAPISTNAHALHLDETIWEGQTYTNLNLGVGHNANLLGLRFLARHLVTLDFPHQTMYLKQTSIGPI